MAGRGVIDRRRLTLLLVPIGIFTACGYIGTALAPTLVTNYPLALLALDSRLRHLLLVAGGAQAEGASVVINVPVWAFFLVGFARLLAADPFWYLLGRDYGAAGLRWFERTTGAKAPVVGFVERHFPKVGSLFVFVLPNNVVCLIAGHTGMPPRRFWPLNVAGTLTRLALVWWVGGIFSGPLGSVLDWVSRNQLWLIGASVVLVVAQATYAASRSGPGTTGVDEAVEELEESVEEIVVERTLDQTADDLGAVDAFEALDAREAEQTSDDPEPGRP